MDEKISELEALNYEGWDGYGAKPIDKKTIANLKALVRIVTNWDFDKWQIAPGVNGDIYLNYKHETISAGIVITPDEFTHFISVPGGKTAGGTNKFNSNEVVKVMNDIHNELVKNK